MNLIKSKLSTWLKQRSNPHHDDDLGDPLRCVYHAELVVHPAGVPLQALEADTLNIKLPQGIFRLS